MKRFYILLGVVAVVGVVVVAVALRGGGTATVELVDLGEITDEELVGLAQGAVYGDPDAPITILEFADYQCSHCGTFALSVKPLLETEYLQTGRAKLVLHDFPTGMFPHSVLAARAARCAGDQDRYFDYHDQLFRTQMDWYSMPSATDHFKQLADDIGLDAGEFRGCLDSDRHADVVTANRALGERLGVTGTPSIFVHDGETMRYAGGFQYGDVVQALEAAGAGN